MNYRQDTGRSGEEQAAEFLVEKGFSIIERNVRYGRFGEIDLVARRENLIIFAEVKKRNGNAFGGALYSISGKKQRSLRKTALHYITSRGLFSGNITFRFDLIAIENSVISWHRDIIR